MTTAEPALRDAEANALFHGLENLPGLVLAVSGGSDSTALLVMAARWAKQLKKRRPKLLAVTIDHGLRPESAREAAAVKRLARRLGVSHRTLAWRGSKPKTGLQETARLARYALLAQAARREGYEHVLTAHTLDDQAETVLFRLARGSGVTGLAGMAYASPLPAGRQGTIFVVRPLLHVAKSRLVATLKAARVTHSDDPSNRDPRFTRVRIRKGMPMLEREGLDAGRLALLARRARRADLALEAAVDEAVAELAPLPWPKAGPIALPAGRFGQIPAEVSLRLLGRAVACAGNEGPVELGKLEALHAGLAASPDAARFRRTLAGAVVTRSGGRVVIERAPARRTRGASNRP